MQFYPILVARYRAMLEKGEEFHLNEYDNTNHLLWMLDELESNGDQTLTKKHRWLGYIQHAIISVGLTDVMTERNYTRNIFDGD